VADETEILFLTCIQKHESAARESPIYFYRSPFFFVVIWKRIAEQIGIAQEETATTIQSGSDSGTVVKIICRAELSTAANKMPAETATAASSF